jgi:hypothetical protein
MTAVAHMGLDGRTWGTAFAHIEIQSVGPDGVITQMRTHPVRWGAGGAMLGGVLEIRPVLGNTSGKRTANFCSR